MKVKRILLSILALSIAFLVGAAVTQEWTQTEPDCTITFRTWSKKVPIYEDTDGDGIMEVTGYNTKRAAQVTVTGKRKTATGEMVDHTITSSWASLPQAAKNQALPWYKWVYKKWRTSAIAVTDDGGWLDPEE